jgi:hypothetical protein
MPSFIEIGQKKGAIAIFIDAKLDSVGHCLLTKMCESGQKKGKYRFEFSRTDLAWLAHIELCSSTF